MGDDDDNNNVTPPKRDVELEQGDYEDEIHQHHPSTTSCGGVCSINTWNSYQSRNAILSVWTLNGMVSLMTLNGIVAFFCINAGFSIFCINSVLSISSINSFLSIGCSGGWMEICGDFAAAAGNSEDDGDGNAKAYDGSNDIVVTCMIILCLFALIVFVQLFIRRAAIVQSQQ